MVGISGLTKLAELNIKRCPKLSLEMNLSSLNHLKKISIVECWNVYNTTLPYTLIQLTVQRCMKIQVKGGIGHLRKLTELHISECPVFEEMPVVCGLSCLERITIDGWSKFSYLHVTDCPILKAVRGNLNMGHLAQLMISDCPELEELPCFAHLTFLVEIRIFRCTKLQKVTLPRTLKKLQLNSCKELKNVSEISGLKNLVELIISQCEHLKLVLHLESIVSLQSITFDGCGKLKSFQVNKCQNLKRVSSNFDVDWISICGCPKLEELSIRDSPRLSCLEKINIGSCNKLQNITLPANLSNLIVQRCRHLQKIAGMDDLSKLTVLDITECPEMELPFLAELSCLERITINSSEKLLKIILPTSVLKITVKWCRNLQVVAGIGNLSKLTELCISQCPQIEDLPILFGLNSPESISINGCEKLNCLMLTDGGISEGVPCSFDMGNLVQSWISDCTALEELPCFARLTCLEGIHMIRCTKLQTITVLSGLRNLERIKIDGCKKLNHLQMADSDCAISKGKSHSFDPGHLSQLWISDCPEFKELSCFARLTCLEGIHIFRCRKLKKITFPMSLKNLQLESCKELKSVSEISHLKNLVELIISKCRQLEPELRLEDMDSLQSVTFDGCGKMIVIDSCEKLQSILLSTTLIKLRVRRCRQLKMVAGIGNLTKFTDMCIGECPELEELPILAGLSCLKSINIDSCDRLHSLSLPTTLIELKVQLYSGLQRITGIGNLTKLQELSISECCQLEYLPSFAGVNCLERIKIDSCDKLHSLRLPTTLIKLNLQLCRGLQTVRGIHNLTKLEELSISECPELEELPRYANPSLLEMIAINSCENFHKTTLPTTHRKLRIQGCGELQRVAINECPKPKELSTHGRLNCLKGTIIESCEGQENIEGIEELEALEAIQFLYCSNAAIKDCISKLKLFISTLHLICNLLFFKRFCSSQ